MDIFSQIGNFLPNWYILQNSFWADRTPVHEAARRGETARLRQLIESGACVNAVTYDSITPLHEASLRGQAQCVRLLIEKGAEILHFLTRSSSQHQNIWIFMGTVTG
uniref:Uncharacterized protein n=1 Tax=Junco hyemalis TaxID=40217 RepID=A0A8C5JP58_JUNHY